MLEEFYDRFWLFLSKYFNPHLPDCTFCKDINLWVGCVLRYLVKTNAVHEEMCIDTNAVRAMNSIMTEAVK